MKKRVFLYVMFLLAFLFFCTCAGYKRGYYSYPYTGDTDIALPSPNSSYEMNKSKILYFKDFMVYISLNNELQTSDMTYFLLLPVPESLEDKAQYDESKPVFFISLAVFPKIDAIVLEPDKVSLIVDGVPLHVKESRYTAMESINYWYYGNDQVKQLPLVRGEKVILEKNKWNYLAIYFKGRVPVVDQDVRLDLADAISLPESFPIPTIRFRKLRYGKWYG
jgi:hypothetical protein